MAAIDDDDLPEGADALYASPPEGFVEARDRVARELRGAGDRPAADRVGALRRPTVAAWLVNATARRSPDQLDALLALRRDLVRAQRQVLSGVKADLTGLVRQRRALIEDLLAVTQQIADEEGRDLAAHREAVRLTFEAAAADEGAADAVRAGRLPKPLPAPAGFGTLAGLAAVPDPPPTRAAPREPTARRDPTGAGEVEHPEAGPGQAEQDRAERDRAELDRAAQEQAAQRAAELAAARRLRDDIARAAEQARTHARQVALESERLEAAAEQAAAEADRRQREAESAAIRATQARRAADAARTHAETAAGRARRARDAADEVAARLAEADALLGK